ncbi:MAG: hypothetical protein RLY20_1350 [Verrucomicrobiota bacterium]|jgi:hypothetical protein
MNKLSKTKRNMVLLVWLITLAVLSGWALMFLKWQLDEKHIAEQSFANRQSLFITMTNTLARADLIERERGEAEQELAGAEASMAGGDIYSWCLDTLQKFKQGYKNIEMPQFGQNNAPVENTLLPKFPYKQTVLSVGGTARFHDLGMFIADFENQFKFARIVNVELQPSPAISGNERDREKLTFKMDIIFLVKPNRS